MGVGGLDPTVTGALIAAGAAFIGFGASALTMHSTDRSNQKVGFDFRLWERKAALYEALYETISDVKTNSGGGTWDGVAIPAEGELERLASVHDRLAEHQAAVWLYARHDVANAYQAALWGCEAASKPGCKVDELAGAYQTCRYLKNALRNDIQGRPLPLPETEGLFGDWRGRWKWRRTQRREEALRRIWNRWPSSNRLLGWLRFRFRRLASPAGGGGGPTDARGDPS